MHAVIPFSFLASSFDSSYALHTWFWLAQWSTTNAWTYQYSISKSKFVIICRFHYGWWELFPPNHFADGWASAWALRFGTSCPPVRTVYISLHWSCHCSLWVPLRIAATARAYPSSWMATVWFVYRSSTLLQRRFSLVDMSLGTLKISAAKHMNSKMEILLLGFPWNLPIPKLSTFFQPYTQTGGWKVLECSFTLFTKFSRQTHTRVFSWAERLTSRCTLVFKTPGLPQYVLIRKGWLAQLAGTKRIYIDFPIETTDPNISGGFVPFPYSLCVFVYFASSCLVKI